MDPAAAAAREVETSADNLLGPLGGEDLRGYLSRLQAVLALAQFMAQSRDEDLVLSLAGSSVPSLGRFRLLGIHLAERGWHDGEGSSRPSSLLPPHLDAQLSKLKTDSGGLAAPDSTWAWAYSLRSLEGFIGHLAVASEVEPPPWEDFLLRMLTQEASIAVSYARLDAKQRALATDLLGANATLATAVSDLKHSAAIHERLTQVAAAGEGEQGIAEALYDLTGSSVAIEDRHGNLRAWGGPGRPERYQKESGRARAGLIEKAQLTRRPIRVGTRLLAIASPRTDVLGLIVLTDVAAEDSERALVALEHGVTVLAMELARLHSVAETELRLGRDLVEELLANTDEQAAVSRAAALGYDLRSPHRIAIIVEDPPTERDPDSRFHAVRRAARDAPIGTLLVPRGDSVVVLCHADGAWDSFCRLLSRELSTEIWVGVGGSCEDLSAFQRSHHEATLALRMRNVVKQPGPLLFYDRLGAFRLLAEVSDSSAIESFVNECIGTLITYDHARDADLVGTLTKYLECGGNYDATASALGVHRNTLKYRLRRIREIASLELRDPDTVFNLHLATRAWATKTALEHPN